MITQTVNGIVTDPVFIGRKGENLSTQIYFDLPADLAEYAYTVYMRRPKEREAYPVANISSDGSNIIWTVSNVDTAISGIGEVQIRFTENNVLVKTMIYTVEIGRAIDTVTSDAPSWQETWLDALTDLAEQTHTNAENAAESASDAYQSEVNAKASEDAAAISASNASTSETNAADSAEDAEAWAVGQRDGTDVDSSDETYENNSKYYANLAQQVASEAGYVQFYIDSSGYLHYVKTSSADLTFYLQDGYLHVTI